MTYKIAAIGEVLWDVFPSGARFGGAPANFACTAAELGRSRMAVSMVSCVGDDQLGRRARQALSDHGVLSQYVATSDHETGKVIVELDDDGRASYRFAEDTAWDNLESSPQLDAFASELNAVCFGTLGQRSDVSRATIQRFVRAASANESALRVLDVNLRPPFFDEQVVLQSLELANVLKLNDEELLLLAEICRVDGDDAQRMSQLADRFDLIAVALTRGERGAVILRGSSLSRRDAVTTQIVDTVGAGDAFTAALTLGMLDGDALDEINAKACELAAYVCSQSGATPHIPRRFSNSYGDGS